MDAKTQIYLTEYLIELNLTGTLPDEIDETSNVSEFDDSILVVDVANFSLEGFRMKEQRSGASVTERWGSTGQCIKMWISFQCFVRCYLERMGILKSDIIDRERGMEVNLARNEDILDDCMKESRGMLQTTNPKRWTTLYVWLKLFIFTVNIFRSEECVCACIFLLALCYHMEFSLRWCQINETFGCE